MGAEPSKPTFPTESQWAAWKAQQADEFQANVQKMHQAREVRINEHAISIMEYYNDYMRECHDKSLIKQKFIDNEACTNARSKLIQYSIKTAMMEFDYSRVEAEVTRALKR
jgi:hypothetical protein